MIFGFLQSVAVLVFSGWERSALSPWNYVREQNNIPTMTVDVVPVCCPTDYLKCLVHVRPRVWPLKFLFEYEETSEHLLILIVWLARSGHYRSNEQTESAELRERVATAVGTIIHNKHVLLVDINYAIASV